MRSDSDLHEPRTNAEQSETGGDVRVSYESEWADLEAPAMRFAYHEHQLKPNERYSGILDCMSIEEARALFEELLDRFHVCAFNRFPLPPTGLPGFRAEGYGQNSPEAALIEIGLDYALAIIRSQPRTMHLRWQAAGDFISKIETRVAGKTIADWFASNGTEQRQTAQFVYFIGAASGPIKIGMAVRPAERLKTLQTSHHERLELLATRKGGQPQERAYHLQFAERRLNGEWFERCPEIEAEIDRLTKPSRKDSQ